MERTLADRAKALETLADAKAAAEKQLAMTAEGLSRVESLLADVKTRLELAEAAREDLVSRLDVLNIQKSKLEESLASKTEAVARVEEATEDLRARLKASTGAHEHALGRLEIITSEKSKLESVIAEQSATLSSKSEAVQKLSERLEQSSLDLNADRQAAGELRSRLATTCETLEQERTHAKERLALITDAKDRMTQEFKILAAEVMTTHGETFSKQNKEQIDTILTPLREKLGEFQQGLQTAYTESAKERATLAEQIRHLSENSAKITLETSNLTRALKGESQTQGAWGEMILTSILERSGLRAGEEYVIQQSHETDEGHRLRPDVVVNLPGGQRIVIDSKVSLVAFNDHVNADTDLQRSGELTRHVASIRSHIRTLSSKEYHSAAGSQLDYVVMFIPIEGALASALQEDPNLTTTAVEANVAIATPTTLMIALRTVANVWQVERRNRNVETIARQAGKIYDKLAGFVEDMSSLGSRITQARTSYDEAMAKLSSGRGNLVSQVERLKELGAKTNKSLPAYLRDESDTEMTSTAAG